ncbi:type III secretion system LEE co-chaperone EscE, partial [Escherichia coli]|nr:type III secretion system LEE co-chaperone EscE [Escherichia coli]
MITITELEDEIIKNKEAANVFIEKINNKKNEIHEKMKHPLDKV